MSDEHTRPALARRSFLARFGAGTAAFGAAFVAGAPKAEAQSQAPAASWQPVRHAEDDWFEQVPAKHRVFFDTTGAHGFGEAIFVANNTFTANRSGYGLADADVAVVICARHESTPFAYTDAMWAKYGAALSERAAAFTDPKTKQPPAINVFQAGGYTALLSNQGVLLDAVLKRGVRLAVCSLATRAAASLIARRAGAKADDVFKELTENLVPNARMVPAGIVAVNRAQERGYSFAYIA